MMSSTTNAAASEHVLHVTFCGHPGMDGMELNRLLSFGRSSTSVIQDLCITIRNSNSCVHSDSTTTSSTGLCFPWKMICTEISHWHHLRHLSLLVTSSSPSQPQSSNSQPPKKKNGTVLPLRAFATLLPHLQTLKLSGIGFVSDHDHDDASSFVAASDFAFLQEMCAAATALQSVEILETYFLYQPTAMESSWMQCSKFVASFSKLSNLQTLVVTASTAFSRPALTLHALHSILSPIAPSTTAFQAHHPNPISEDEEKNHSSCSSCVLQTLCFENMTIWGGGSAVQCANALRNNKSLRSVQLSHIVFAGDESILAGLDQNTSIRHLVLTGCMLHLEAKALAQALRQNQTVQTLLLNHARFGVDERIHTNNLCRVVRSIRHHPTLHTLQLQGTVPITMMVSGGAYLPSLDNNNNNHHPPTACYQAILDMLQSNRLITELVLDSDHHHHRHKLNPNGTSNNSYHNHVYNDGNQSSHRYSTISTSNTGIANSDGETSSYHHLMISQATAIDMIQYQVGLNKAGFWNLSQAETNPHGWIDGLSKVSDNLSCTWTILREHPLLVAAAAAAAVHRHGVP